MPNCGAMFSSDQQPALPLADLLCQKKIEQVALLPIGAKIKSFKINHQDPFDSFPTQALKQKNIKLPNFVDLQSYPLNVYSQHYGQQMVSQTTDLVPVESQCRLRASNRFWWHWLLLTSTKISILVSLILFQSSFQGSNLLEKAKIYIDLDSQEAATLPASSIAYLKDSQASPFNRAIEESRKIEVDSPFYREARRDITRWSEIILDIAKGRASDGDLIGAIAAAKLIPQNNSSTQLIAQEATVAMEDWQLRAQTQDLNHHYLTKAKAQISINPDEASSYNQAIGILQQIIPGAEEYSEARNLISRWNKQIYLIAERRADKGNFQQAIEAALLITQDSLYYRLAQDSINHKIKSMYVEYIE
jgi:hypothetical protein